MGKGNNAVQRSALQIRHPAAPSSVGDLARYHRDMVASLDQFARDVANRQGSSTATSVIMEFDNGRFKQDGDSTIFQLKDDETGLFYEVWMHQGRIRFAAQGEK